MPLPSGIITIWSGALIDIPAGYVLCDGNNGTPDLTGLFVRGAGDGWAVGDNGGNQLHNHFFTSNTHTHTLPSGAIIGAGANLSRTTSADAVTGQTENSIGVPPYWALAYIMKT